MYRTLAILSLAAALWSCAQTSTTSTVPATPMAKGQAASERACALCHQVVPDKPSQVEAAAPSFMEIANLPGRNRNYLRQFMVERHNVETLGETKVPMPTESLDPDEREDVIAYLLTFQTDPATGDKPPTKLEPFE
jgi:hypothetical protein